jgi:phospholipid transport system substrate-binding protein
MKTSASTSLLLGLLLVALPGAAASASPRAQLEDVFLKATRILEEAPSARHAEEDMRRLVQTQFDVPSAARRVLEPEWEALGVAEREEFIRLFGDRLLRAYLGVVRGLLLRDRPPTVRVVAEEIRADGRVALVRTIVPSKAGTEVRFDYFMTPAQADWLVHDVVVDGVSLIENYRAQLARVLQASSYAGLVARLRAGTLAAEGPSLVPRTPPRGLTPTP